MLKKFSKYIIFSDYNVFWGGIFKKKQIVLWDYIASTVIY
jgi:hypothetical protein